jgi:large subunit ribosomal protein L1
MISRFPSSCVLSRSVYSFPSVALTSLSSVSPVSSIFLLSSRVFSSRSTPATSTYFVLNGVPMTSDVQFPLEYAVRIIQSLRAGSHCKDVEKISLAVHLNLDPRKPNQSLKGSVVLPYGTGATIRVAVFARGQKAEEEKAAGADYVGETDLVEMIQAGKFDFDRLIATPDTMALVGRVARILGPRGLMPNPKLGTVTNEIASAIKTAKAGQVQFKTDKAGIVHAPVGKLTLSAEALKENIEVLVNAIEKYKPSGAKSKYYKSAFLSSTQGGSVQVDINSAPFKIIQSKNLPESQKKPAVGASVPAS